MLWELTNANSHELKWWLYDPRIAWGGATPMQLLQTGKAEAVASYLEGLLDGEVVGS